MKTADAVATFLKSCESRGLSSQTVRWYRGCLKHFASEFLELPLAPELIEAFLQSYPGDERRHGVFRTLRAFYNFLERRFGLANPVTKLTPPRVRPKEKRTLSPQELHRLLNGQYSPDVQALLYLLVDTGIRIGEAANLTFDDVFDGYILVKGKTGERKVPISPSVRDMLRSLGEEGRIFPVKPETLTRKVRLAFRKAGLEGSAHTLRHTFATLWKGSDLALKAILGHSSFRMVEWYSHHRESKAIEQHRQFSPLAILRGNGGNGGSQEYQELLTASYDHEVVAAAQMAFNLALANFARKQRDHLSYFIENRRRLEEFLISDWGCREDPQEAKDILDLLELLYYLYSALEGEHRKQAVFSAKVAGFDREQYLMFEKQVEKGSK